MLKIGKGLKKKKKSKKHKKDEELFTQEELEQYRREHQLRTEGGVEEAVTSTHTASSAVDGVETQHQEGTATESKLQQDNDEWKKFNALTTGVDSILKKTQGDLDRIKSTSFFKRTPPPKPPAPPPAPATTTHGAVGPSDSKNWIDFNKDNQNKSAPGQQVSTAPVVEGLVEESESEYESEEDDNIFDTSYVDVVASGEIKLAYIPDSPDDKDPTNADNDFDPFDTSVADKIICGPQVSKKGKKLVSIGAAVEVLTGRVDSDLLPNVIPHKKSSRRTQPTDLLLDDGNQLQQQTDSNGNLTSELSQSNVGVASHQASKSLLDDDNDIDDVDIQSIDLSKSLVIPQPPPQQTIDNVVKPVDLSEFETTPDDLDDEFTSLAAESLKINDVKVIAPDAIKQQTEINTNWNAEFTTTELVEDTVESDPFDTSTIDQIKVPGKVELKFIEAELLGDNNTQKLTITQSLSDPDFNPRQDEDHPVQDKDVSNILEDNEASLQTPVLKPQSTQQFQFEDTEEEVAVDPFDTSFIATVVPGKAELKLIENELAELETKQVKSIQLEEILKEKDILLKPKVEEQTGGDDITDLLFVDEHEINIKALTPSVERQEELSYVDPFDTTNNAFNVLPGKAELKLLENELLTIQTPTTTVPVPPSASAAPTDLLSNDDVQHDFNEQLIPLQPTAVNDKEFDEDNDDFDPFDTTAVTTNLVPGIVELKIIESELIQ